jgi:putative ABC transport system permease protein
MQAILQDLRYGLKLLAKSPFFTLVTVLSLAIGIMFSTTALNILNEYFLQSLPSIVKDRDSLVWLLSRNRKHSSLNSLFSYPDYISLKDQNPAFSGIAAYAAGRQFNLQSGDRIHPIQGSYVSGNFFSLLGVQPVL